MSRCLGVSRQRRACHEASIQPVARPNRQLPDFARAGSWLHRLRYGLLRFVRRLHRYYNGIRLLGSVHRRLRLLVFPTRTDGVHPPAKPEASRFPCKELPHMLRVFDHAGLGGRSRYRASHVAFRDSDHVGVRKYQAFAARWLAYALPCQRFAGILANTDA
jgi:hypothetical protein